MSEAEPTIPFLHTRYLSRCQQKACNKNPTYRGRLTGLHTIRNELHRLRDLLAVRETGELGLMPRNSLKKTLRLGARDSLALQLQQQRATQEEDALVKRIRADYQVQEQRMLEWDDQCAALAESLLAKPKVRLALADIVQIADYLRIGSSMLETRYDVSMDIGVGFYLQGLCNTYVPAPVHC